MVAVQENAEKSKEKTRERKFNKSLFGLNQKDVDIYISDIEKNQIMSAEAFERKLEEQSAALSMALREKEKTAQELAAATEKLNMLNAECGTKQSELAAENYILKARIADLEDVEKKNAALATEINNLKSRCEHSEAENKILQKTIAEKEEVILSQCRKYSEIEKNLKLEVERVKAEAESKEKVYELKIETVKENLNQAVTILGNN